MITVKGKNVKLYVKKGGVYVLAICSTNLSRRQSGGTLTTLVKGAGNARRFKPTISEESLTFEGLLTIDTPADYQMFDFVIGGYNTVRIIYDDASGNTVQLDGETLVTGIDDNNGAADWSTWSVSMVKNGKWLQSGTGVADTTPPIVTSARATGPNTVRVTFNESVNASELGFTVKINGVSGSVTSVSGSGTIWDFTTTNVMSPGDILLLNYNSVAGNTLDLIGNELDDFLDYPIENVIIGTGYFTGFFGYSGSIAFPITALDALTPQFSSVFVSGGPMTFGTSTVPSNVWMYFKEPVSEPVKTGWFNTTFNNGTFPDSVFKAPQVVSGFRYYVSRNRMSLDNTQPITAS